jgi:hypothetical protein
MNKKCPKCESIAVIYEDYVGGTSFYRCKTCGYRGCDFERQTVFDHITQSVETLAEKLVYYLPEIDKYTSEIIAVFYKDRDEALAATIEELKKEYKK